MDLRGQEPIPIEGSKRSEQSEGSSRGQRDLRGQEPILIEKPKDVR